MSGHQDSNLGPPAPKAGALPGCATPRIYFADGPGFEPGVQGYPYVGLANRWFQPLTHPSTVPLFKSGRKGNTPSVNRASFLITFFIFF